MPASPSSGGVGEASFHQLKMGRTVSDGIQDVLYDLQLFPSSIPYGACATRRSDPFSALSAHGYSKDVPTKVGTDIHSPLLYPLAWGCSRPSVPLIEVKVSGVSR